MPMPLHRYFYITCWCYARHLNNTRSHTKIAEAKQKLEALLQMQKTDPFCKRISKRLSNGKAPKHETDIFTQVRGLLYKHITDSGQKLLALVIPKSWRYTVLVEVHDKLGHQGNTCTYCLIKCQYYWKGMNKDIRIYITNCALYHGKKGQSSGLPTTNDRDSRQAIW